MILAVILILVGITCICVLYFYRDPERQVRRVDNAVLSPADGSVVSIRRYVAGVTPTLSKDGRYFRIDELTGTTVLGSDGTIISIHISPLDIHTIRSPTDAKVTHIYLIKGGLKFMRDPTFEVTNERVSMVMETAYGSIGLVIVGAPIASSVKLLTDVGNRVLAGERVARIRLGSLANLIIPDECKLKLAVSCGKRVRAGITVVATQSEESVLHEECHMPKNSTVLERLYLIFLAVYTIVRMVWASLRRPKVS